MGHLNLIGAHLPSKCTLSVYKLKKFFMDLHHDISFSKHYCCSSCHNLLEESSSTGCTGSTVEFLSISLAAQLKRKLEDKTIWEHLQKRFDRVQPPPDHMQDVFDGKEYMKHKVFLSEKANVSLTLNTDGTDVFRSSSASLYPVWLTINELPSLVRFNTRNLLLGGLWFSKAKPTMSTFLHPIIDEINLLTNKGVCVKTPDGELTCKVRLLMCSVDLVARAPVLNMKQFNGKYGCCYCEEEGRPRPNTHLHRTWPYSASSTPRIHRGIIANAKEATKKKDAVKGIKGATVLCSHHPFNLCVGMVIDVMHCVFLGVLKKGLMKFWFTATHHAKPFSLRRKMDQCDERVLNIAAPHDFSRAPRSLHKLPHWKASEFCSWLLYYSLPFLDWLLPELYLTHYSLLVAAMHILLSDSVSATAVERARIYLLRFYEMYSTLYGDNGCTMNKHLPDCVSNWGPLWGYSCFPFES